MEKPLVLVSHEADYAIKREYFQILKDHAEVEFLSDVGALRNKLLREVSVLSCFFPHSELSTDDIAAAHNLKLVQLITSGANHVRLNCWPVAARFATNPGAQSDQIAEHAIALMLAAGKNITERHERMRKGHFDQHMENRQLRGAVCGIVGFGGIGQATARLCRALGMKILALNRSGKTSEPVDFVGTLRDIDRVLSECDFLVLSVDLSNETRGLIAARELALMKSNAVLVNVARAHIVDERSLYEHLRQKPDFIACIDAWWKEPSTHGAFSTDWPILELPNVIGSPHNASRVPGIVALMSRKAASNVRDFLLTGKVAHEVAQASMFPAGPQC